MFETKIVTNVLINDHRGPIANCLLLLLISVRNKNIIGRGHTDQMRKLSATNASGQSSDLTGAHCAQQGRPFGPAPAQPRRSSQRVLHC